jgi:hypothetical protein
MCKINSNLPSPPPKKKLVIKEKDKSANELNVYDQQLSPFTDQRHSDALQLRPPATASIQPKYQLTMDSCEQRVHKLEQSFYDFSSDLPAKFNNSDQIAL